MSIGQIALSFLPRWIVDRIETTPLGRRLVRGAFWSLAGTVGARALRLPISIGLARIMGPAAYGEFGIVSASIDLCGVFAGLGLGMTATKYVAELRLKEPARAGRIIAVTTVVATVGGAAVAIALLAGAPWVAARLLAAPQLALPLRIGALALFFSTMSGAQAGALYGFEAFRVAAMLQAIVGVLDLPFMLGGYFLGGLHGVLGGMAASRASNWLLTMFALRAEALRHGIPHSFSGWKRELPVVWKFSIPAALGGIMVIPVNWICSALLVNQPHGYAEMGAYNAANQWYATLMFIPSALGFGLLPIVSERLGVSDGRSSGRILKTLFQINGAILIPCGMIMSLLSPWIMRIYGAGYRDAWPTLIAVVWTAAIMGILNPVGDVIAASGKMWMGLFMNAGWAAVFIISTLLLVHRGSLGLASSRLIAYVIHSTWTLAFAAKVMRATRPEIAGRGGELSPVVTD